LWQITVPQRRLQDKDQRQRQHQDQDQHQDQHQRWLAFLCRPLVGCD
jgi:hypothetical protein